MFEDRDDAVERVVRYLKRPAHIDPALDRRVMAEITRLPAPRGPRPFLLGWLTRRRVVSLSPLGALAAAAGLVVLAFVASEQYLGGLRGAQRAGAGQGIADAARVYPFVVLAPRATRVSLVGDFNDWDAARTPMRRVGEKSAVWTTVVPLAPGRYRYAFLADGARWLADPTAPLARDDEFGPPSSVLTVGGS
ncbi:MAG TPA: isoamylase early set domain-containing protein [Gemmatimonadales bacterium]|nr:isoamylase early set domain-containing protein [Gemmatimonadales bacterium]